MKTNELKNTYLHGAGTRFLVLLAFVVGVCSTGWAQQITGSIVGTVKDPQGAVVNTANVRATNMGTGFVRGGADKWIWRVPH